MARNKQLICLRDQARSLRHIGTTGKSPKCCQVLFADAMHLFLEKTANRAGLVLRYPRDERIWRCPHCSTVAPFPHPLIEPASTDDQSCAVAAVDANMENGLPLPKTDSL
jgi:hypothetical protein